jgi:hypothetical protein
MDDLSMLICAPTNAALVSKTQLAISLLLDDCLDFQMEPNLRRGKTEVMFAFKGGQSRKFRKEYYSGNAGLTVVCERQTYSVSVVSRYIHLGGLIHHKDVNKQEIKRRFAIANQAFQQHKKLIYRNQNLSWNVRCDIFNTLIMSKLLYGLESWTFPTIQSRLQIHNGVMKLYKRLLGAPHDAHLSDLDILVQTNMPDPTELLRRARLRYFGTLHNCKFHAHWGLLQEDTAWVELVRDDLQWLWRQIGASTKLEDPTQHFLQWRDIIVHHSVYWKKSSNEVFNMRAFSGKENFMPLSCIPEWENSCNKRVGLRPFPHKTRSPKPTLWTTVLDACNVKENLRHSLGKVSICAERMESMHESDTYLMARNAHTV